MNTTIKSSTSDLSSQNTKLRVKLNTDNLKIINFEKYIMQ